MKNVWNRLFGTLRGLTGWSSVQRDRRGERLGVEALEERLALSAAPTVSLLAPPTAFIGETVPVALTFSNTGDQVGYSPWAYVVLHSTGADGNDGISFVPNTATYLGAAVTTVLTNFDNSGKATGPSFSRDPATDQPLQLTGGTPNDQVVFFQLPFGSFAVGQPNATINFTASLSNQAYVGTALSLQARGGFALGNTPLDEGVPTDPPLLGNSASASVTPTILQASTTYLGAESETATGADYKRQYKVTVDIANGQSVSSLNIQDVLPDSLQFVSLDAATVNGVAVTPTVFGSPSTTTPGGTLSVGLGNALGTAGNNDADLTFTVYVPRDRATPPNPAGTMVLNLATGAFASATSQASAQAFWTPLNVNEPAGIVTSNLATSTLQEKSVATQKTVSVVGGGAVRPGSVLQYTINFQVSDYFALQNVVLPDLLGDGIRFDNGTAPTLSFSQQGGAASTGTFQAASYIVGGVSPVDGSQPITFNLSTELIARGLSGKMIGGAIPLVGTGSGAVLPQNSNPSPFGATQGSLVFRAVVQQDYSVTTSANANKNVKQGDVLGNTAAIAADLLSYANTTAATGSRPSDNTAANVNVARGALAEHIYAINGVAPASAMPQVAVGDLITYRLTYLLPTSTVENLKLTDFLPLPVLQATDMTNLFSGNVSAGVPALNTAKFGPGVASLPAGFSVPAGTVDYSTIFGPTGQNRADYLPTIGTNGATNTVQFAFPQNIQDNPLQRDSLVDILFTVQVGSEPFADGLFLTNQANVIEGSTNNGTAQSDGIVQFELTEPSVVQLTQGVVATDALGATYSSSTPVPFNAPGTVGPRFTGTINSTNLTTTPINSNLSGVQAGRLVTFAIVVKNDGLGRKGAFDVAVKDQLPAGFVIPTSGAGLNLQVFDGSGQAAGYTLLGVGASQGLFGNGIQLIDPGVTVASPDGTNGGAIDPTDPSNGHNIAIITYDLQVADSVQPNATLTNTATLVNYASAPSGPNFVPNGLTATDLVTTLNVLPTKSVFTTSETATTGNNATIGAIVRYRLIVQVPQATAPNFQLQDNLPAGLTFLNDGTATAAFVSDDGGLTSSTVAGAGLNQVGDELSLSGIDPTYQLVGAAITGGPFGDGTDPIFNFGTLTNSDRNNHQEYVVVSFNALVENVSANANGSVLTNNFTVNVGGSTLATSNSVPVTVLTPVLGITKSVSQSTAQVGDTVDYTVTFTNTGASTGFETTLRDATPAFLTMVPGSVAFTSTGGAAGITNSSAGNNVSLNIATLPVGASVTVTYSATVQPGVLPNQALTNSARVETTTLPGLNGTPVGDPNNTTGSANTGTTGSATGERIGTGTSPNTLFALGSSTVTIQTPGNTEILASTSEVSTTGNNVAVGEVVRYRLVAQVPRSTMPGFQLDNLLPAGMSYLPGNTRVAFVTATGTAITSSTLGTTPGVATTDVTTVVPSFDLESIGGTVGTDAGGHPLFSLGNLVNSGTGANPEYVVLEFNALVNNTAAIQAGVNLDDNFTVQIAGSQSGLVSNTVRTTVATPNISNLTKSISASTGDAGDTVTYTVSWSNAGGATAFDVHLSDALPGFVTRTGGVNVAMTGIVTGVSTAATAGNTVDVVLTSMAPGATVTLTYTATINTSVPATQVIKNTANLTYTSLPGSNGTLLTDSNNPTGGQTPGAPGSTTGERDGLLALPQDNYTGSSFVNFTVTKPTLTNAVFATSLVGTAGTKVNINEQVTYRLTATLEEGSFPGGLKLTDALPAGMTYVSSQIISIGNSISGSSLGVGATGTLAGANVVFDLGAGVVNTPDNVSDANDRVVFEVIATVADVPGNKAGNTLTTSGTLFFGTGTTAPVTAAIQEVEPTLTVAKSVVGDATLDANATASYQVVISNPAGANAGVAFDLSLSDTLPTGLTLVPGSVAVVSVPAYATATVTPGNSVNVGISELRAGDSVTLSYQATVLAPPTANAPAPGAVLVNTASANYDSLPGAGGRVGPTASGTASVSINSNTITGDIYWDANHSGTFDGGDAAIAGASLRFHLFGTDNLGQSVDTIVSTATGIYQFTGLRPGTYSIQELDQPVGYLDYRNTAGNSGNPFGGTAGAVGTNLVSSITILPDSNQTQANFNFGKLLPSSIAGTLYEDKNANGQLNAGEPGLGGLGLQLTGLDDLGNSVTANTITSVVNGSFSFTTLRPGTYTIMETTQPAGYFDGLDTAGTAGGIVQPLPADQITAITVSQVNATGYNFAKVLPASLSGFVFDDSANDNGVKDVDEAGLGNVSVQLTGRTDLGVNVTLTTTTSPVDGSYSFGNLRPGTYAVTEGTQPAGYSGAAAAPGNLGGTVALQPAVQVNSIVLQSGSTGASYNFGEFKPIVDLNGPGLGAGYVSTFTEGGGAVASVDSFNLSLLDPTRNLLQSATAKLTALPDGAAETLAVNTAGTAITAAYNSGTGLLTLTGSDTLAHYQQVLRTLAYNNASQDPSPVDRFVNICVTDDIGITSLPATATIHVIPVNNPPAVTVPGAQTAQQGSTLIFSAATGNPLTVSDMDGENGVEKVTVTVVQGTLTLGTTAGLATVTGSATGSVVLTGTLGALNTALSGLVYTPTPSFYGSDTLSIVINDQGNTGIGGPKQAAGSVPLTVNAPPVANLDSFIAVENTPLFIPATSLTVNDTDPESNPLTVTTVSPTSSKGGVLTLTAGVVKYTPPTGYFGSDTFTYTISDGHGGSAVGVVKIGVDAPPTTANNAVGTPVNVTYTFAATDFPFSDPNVGDTRQAVRIDSLPLLGSLTLSGVPVIATQVIPVALVGQLKYTPPANQASFPLTTFTFSVSDGTTFSTSATMTVNVWSPPAIALVPDVYMNNCTSFPFTYTGSFNDGPNAGPFTGTVNYGDGSGVQAITVSASQIYMLAHLYNQRGLFQVDVCITDGHQLTGKTSFFVEAHVAALQSYGQLITINDGSDQRSMITSITVSLGQHETLDAGAIVLTTSTGQNVGFRTVTRDVNGKTVVLVQFTDANLTAGSLCDGRYTITVNGSKIHDQMGAAFNGGSTASNSFFRLFGDVNGDAKVDAVDLTAFRAALRSMDGTAPYRWYFDYDLNCTLDTADYNAFLNRYGRSI